MKKYYVVFLHRDGYGKTELTSNNPLTTFADMEEAKKTIEKSHRLKNVVIINLIEMVGEDNG